MLKDKKWSLYSLWRVEKSYCETLFLLKKNIKQAYLFIYMNLRFQFYSAGT